MRSLSQLNTRGQTTLNYTDLRAAQVIFDRTNAVNQIQNINNRIFLSQPGIEIIEIVEPNVVNVYYEINVSSVSGATAAWPGLPGTIVVSNPGVGIYRASNIDSAADWAAVRAATITLPVGYIDEFTYTATIFYEPGLSKVTSVGVVFQTFLNSQFNITGSITGIQKSFISTSAISNINIRAGKRYNQSATVSANANLTASGRYAVGRLRSVMTSTATVVARGRYAIGTLAANITTTAVMSIQPITIKVINSSISAVVTQTVLITDFFEVTVLTDDVANTDSYFGTQLSINRDATVIAVGNNPDTSPNYSYIFSRSGTTWSQDTRISRDGQALSVVGNSADAYVFIGEQFGGEVFVYKKVTGTWTLDETFMSADTNYSFGRIMHSSDDVGGNNGNATLIVAPDTQDAYVQYYRFESGNPSLTGWFQGKLPRSDYIVYGQNTAAITRTVSNGTNQDIAIPVVTSPYIEILYYNRLGATFTLRGSPAIETGFQGDRKEITTAVEYGGGDVRYLAVGYVRNNSSNPAAGYVKVYISTNEGRNWTLQATFTAQTSAVNDRFGQSLSFNTNQQLVIGSPGEGAVYIYNRSGTTWTLETVLRPNNPTANMLFGETIDIGIGYYAIGAPNGDLTGAGQVYVYRRVAT
jgi:hypothetical protein